MINIKYFGAVAEVTQCPSEKIENKTPKLQEVMQELFLKYKLEQIPVKIALNQQILTTIKGVQLKENDEIAVLPPFAGG